MSNLHEVITVPIDSCVPNTWNPQEEDLATFNELVEQIKQHGFLEPLQVAITSQPGEEQTYQIIGGEHRWKAGKLAGLTEILVVVLPWDEDMQKVQTVKLNMIRGKLDPIKFAALFNDLEKRYGRSAVIKMMGMTNKEKAVEALLNRVKKNMPKKMRDELTKRAEKIRNVEDLATVVQSLYAQHGTTLENSYMFFVLGGRTHAMIRMESESMRSLERGFRDIASRGVIVDDLMERALGIALQEVSQMPPATQTDFTELSVDDLEEQIAALTDDDAMAEIDTRLDDAESDEEPVLAPKKPKVAAK